MGGGSCLLAVIRDIFLVFGHLILTAFSLGGGSGFSSSESLGFFALGSSEAMLTG